MTRWDWVPRALLALGAFGALYLLGRLASRAWGGRWLAFRRQPLWLQGAVGIALLWIALRVARLGWRALMIYVGVLALAAVWGELAAHDTRRAGERRG